MKTEKEKLIAYFRKRGFKISPVLQHLLLISGYWKAPTGSHHLISGIGCCLFDGSDTPKGGIGCVTFYYSGVTREKYRRTTYPGEILKEVSAVHKTAAEVIAAYEEWESKSAKTLQSWKRII